MIKKILIISITLFTIVSSELCVYDKRGTRRYFNKELTDINEIFISLKRKGYITDPYNTYFGNCYSNNGLINIYGVKVNKVEPLENFTKFKREETLKELFDLKEGNRRCNLLTSESAEGNPYSEELTGIKNSNVREGWKLVQVSTKAVDSKNSLSETFSVSFDKSYSISVQKSYSNTEGVTIENHVDHTDSNSFSDSISKVVEETLSKSNSNESGETWDSSFAKDITKTNEQHSETNWNNERNSSDTSGTNSSQENGTNWNNSSTSGSSTTTTTDETKADSVGGGGSIGAFGIGVNGSYTHETSTSKGTSSEVNSSTTNDRGGSSSTTSGTSTDRTVGQSDSTGGSKGLSDSISTSESLTNSNGGSRTVSNSVERSSTTGETEESSKTREIGMTTGNSETSEHSVTYGEDTSVQFSNSTSASFSVEESISGLGTGHPCEIAIYKKIKRHIQITSCYDRDENKNYERNTRSIINIDVDFNAINRYREILNQTDIDPMNLKGDGQILTACVLDSDNSQFKREYNFFEQAKELINGSVKTYNPVMIPGMVLTPNKEQITDRDPTEKNSQFYMRKLTNEGGSMVYYYGNNKLYDTETSNISNNCKFRISSKNHLEMFLDDETLFLPVGSYAEEFESEKSRYKEDPNAPFFNDTIMEIPEPILKPNTTDIPKKGNTNKYIDHLNKDELTYSLFINRGQEECKLIFEFCNSRDEKADEFENYLEETNEDLLDYIYIENICGSKEQFNYSYSEEEIEYICSKNKDELDVINKNNEEIHAKCDCEKYTKCINMQTDNSSFDSFLFTSDCNLLNKEFNCSTQCRTLIARANTPYIADVSNFKIKDVVVWSSVRPEHQNLIVGWNGNNIGYETSYLTLKKYNNYNSDDYEGLTLYDPTGAPIWEFRAEGTSSSDKLDKEGYYLPVKYGYPFSNPDITSKIPKIYEDKNYSYLTMPSNIKFIGNTLIYGGCNNILLSNQGLKSINGRFSLILQENGNLVFKDNKVTIWESKTANLWHGVGPYKLIVGNDGIMRILNKFDYIMMSTNNNPDKENDHKYRYYRLQVLNAGTFRIINENGEEMWNMWSHAPYHEFNVYYEEEFYDSCKSTARNPNLPVITTIDEKSSIIRVGEQLVNRFNKEQFIEYKKKSIIESRKFEKAIKNKNSETSDSGKKKNPFEIEGNNNADLKDGEIFNNNSYLFNNDDLNTDSPTAFLIDDLFNNDRFGDNPFGDNSFGDNPFGDNPFEDDPIDNNPIDDDPIDDEPIDDDPVDDDPLETDYADISVDIESLINSKDYIYDLNNNFYSSARLPLTSFHLKYQNLFRKYEVVDDETIKIHEDFYDLKPITDRDSRIVYGQLTNRGVFNIYDGNNNVLFTTGIRGDDVCTDSKKCFYFMYITPDTDGYVKIMERVYKKDESYDDKLVWAFPPNKKMTELRSDREDDFLKNLESLIYRNSTNPDKDCLNEMSETSNNSEVTENTISKKKEDDNINVRSTIAKRNKRNIHRNKNKRSEVKIQKRDEDEDEEVIEDENGMEDEDVIDDEGGMEDEDVIDDEGGMEDEDVIDDDDGMQYEDVIDDDDGMQYEDVIDDDDDENDGKNDNRNNNRNDNGNDTKKDNQNENNNGKNDSKCNNVINEFSCMTLRSKGVYLYGDSEPFYNYTINTESKLRLDKETGLLTIDGIQIIHLDYPAATPTKIRCEMIDDMYGVALYDRFGVKIWEYPSKIRYYMNNKYPHDTMVVDRSIYYYNNNTRKNEACLDFKKDGLYNGETKITLDIDKETAGRSLYLNKTHIYMQDIHDKIISKSIIKLYNPENHDVKLYCKDKDTIVVADEITNNIVWSYPKKQYTLLSSNTEYNELRPDQQLIYPEESVNNFCLEVKGNNITSIDYPNMLSYDKPNIIEYLGVTNKGVFVHFGNNRKIDLLNNYYGELKNELDNLNEAENANDFNKSQENKEGIYSIKCEKLFGKVKASVYYNDTFLTTLPPYDKKYIINSTSLLYYGEKLYNEDTKEECLIFDDNKLYTRYLNKTIFDSKNTLKRELLNSEYIKIEEKSLLLNNDVALATVQNISGKKKIYGKCMFYHGGNKFVLYSDDYEKVMMEFPSISNKDILQDDDIIYDDLYVDLNASPQEKCIRIGTVNEDKENQSVNAKDEKIGLFFYKETVPFTNITVPSIPYNNTLRFNQENGVLLLNEVDILSKQFTKDLSLKCEKEYGTLYAIIRNSENEEQWRYPSFNKKSSISYKNDEKLETGEYLYDDHNNECFKLSEYGIIIDGELKYKACDNRNVKTCSYTRYLYIDKTKGTDVYMVNFFEDHNKIETILEIKTKSKNINLRCDKSLGLYIIDDDKNILYKSKTQIFNNTNLFTNKNNSVLQVGDQIQTDDKTNCAYIDNELNLVVGDKKFPNANEIKISNKYPPVTIGSTILFEEITNKTLPEHMSLRCKREETETLLVLYDDDNDFIIDEIMNKCRKHKLYVTNEHHNNYICIDDPLKNSYEDMCLLYNKDHKIIDSNQRILFSGYKNRNLISNNLYLDTATGNLIAKDRTEDITLLAINRKNVKMECGKYDEVLITDRNKNDELIWMHRPYLNCENGLELESSDCKSIYKYEKVGNFEINEKSFGKYYKDDIIKLSLNEDGELIANDNKIIIKDEWNVKNKYNYILNCDEDYNCKFINTYNDEIIDYLDKNHVAKSTINPTEKIGMGEKLLCKNVSLVLTNKGLIYRNHKKKVETDFMGELNDIATSDSAVISYAGFDSDYNFKLYYKDQYQPLNLISFKDISGNPSKNKYIRVSCEEDKLEFYEMYKNKKYVYYSFSYPPEPTKTTKKTPTPTPKQSYSEYTFKGVIGNEYYLGVPSLSNISKIEILSSKHNPYFTWIFDSTSSPSFMYLANSKNGKLGKKSNYCLDINDPYISIVNCANAKHKFKYGGGEYSSVLYVYSKNSNGSYVNTNKCIRYTDRPKFESCEDPSDGKYPGFRWVKNSVGTYKEN
jgi:hypothetical protein